MESPAGVLLGFYCFYPEGQSVSDGPDLFINPRGCLASFDFGGFSFPGFGFGTFAFALCMRVFSFLSFAFLHFWNRVLFLSDFLVKLV